jgi:hypothetical protein
MILKFILLNAFFRGFLVQIFKPQRLNINLKSPFSKCFGFLELEASLFEPTSVVYSLLFFG